MLAGVSKSLRSFVYPEWCMFVFEKTKKTFLCTFFAGQSLVKRLLSDTSICHPVVIFQEEWKEFIVEKRTYISWWTNWTNFMFISCQKLSKLFHEAFTNVTKDYRFLYYHLYYLPAIRIFCSRLCCGHFEITLFKASSTFPCVS